MKATKSFIENFALVRPIEQIHPADCELPPRPPPRTGQDGTRELRLGVSQCAVDKTRCARSSMFMPRRTRRRKFDCHQLPPPPVFARRIAKSEDCRAEAPAKAGLKLRGLAASCDSQAGFNRENKHRRFPTSRLSSPANRRQFSGWILNLRLCPMTGKAYGTNLLIRMSQVRLSRPGCRRGGRRHLFCRSNDHLRRLQSAL